MPKKPHSITVIQTFPETITTVCPLLGEVGASSCHKICSRAISFFSFDVIINFSAQTITKLVRLRVQSEVLIELLVEKMYPVIVGLLDLFVIVDLMLFS